MAQNPPIAYQAIPLTLAAGTSQVLPGTFTSLEILAEFQTSDPSVNSEAVLVGLYPNQTPTQLPPGILIQLEPGFPSRSLYLKNTDLVNSITLLIGMGSGTLPFVDHRLTIPNGLDLSVTIAGPDPLPVSVVSPDPLPVSGASGGAIGVIVENAVDTSATPTNAVNLDLQTPFSVSATTTIGAATSGLQWQLSCMSIYTGPSGGSVVVSSGGHDILEFDGVNINMMIPYPLIFPTGDDLILTIGGACVCSGMLAQI